MRQSEYPIGHTIETLEGPVLSAIDITRLDDIPLGTRVVALTVNKRWVNDPADVGVKRLREDHGRWPHGPVAVGTYIGVLPGPGSRYVALNRPTFAAGRGAIPAGSFLALSEADLRVLTSEGVRHREEMERVQNAERYKELAKNGQHHETFKLFVGGVALLVVAAVMLAVMAMMSTIR